MKHEIKNIYGKTIFIADIPDGTESGMMARVALEQAVSSGANLQCANLQGANLSRANLQCANLRSANLQCANLQGANLSRANLQYANLRSADLQCADMSGANLSRANLQGANLRSADLRSANLQGAIGNSQEIKTIQTDIWVVSYTRTHMQIGCQNHSIQRWFNFSDAVIEKMDGNALAFWKKWKPILKAIIDA